LATLRSAELGFFGVVVYTRVHTPRFCGHASKAGTLLFSTGALRGFRTNWLMVGIEWVPDVFLIDMDCERPAQIHAWRHPRATRPAEAGRRKDYKS
jgi:hypothetical protein